MKEIPVALSFDDVLLIPNYSDVLPKETNTETKLTKTITIKIPIISSPMDTVTESLMAIEMAKNGGVGVIHRNMDIKDQVREVEKVKEVEPDSKSSRGKHGGLLVGAAVGVGEESFERVKKLIDAHVDFIVIDTSHGHSKRVIDFLKRIKDKFPDTPIISGNVVTGDGAMALLEAGSDAIKVGIGVGSICTTRIVTGVGVPQFTAIVNAYEVAKEYNVPVISDGGIRSSGDIVKAIGGGADSVMIGSLLAGCDESPAELIEREGKKYKYYRGMGSLPAMKKGSADRYGEDGRVKMVPEGVESLAPYRGKVKDVLFELVSGLRSGMGYAGAKTIEELKKKAKFYRITNMGLTEGKVHDVKEL